MDFAAFAGSTSGCLVPTTHGQQAFLPNRLPPALDTQRLWVKLAETTLALGRLEGLGHKLSNPLMVIRPLQRREALTSSAMEGTHASPDDLVLAEAGAEIGDESAREVHNYLKAMDETVQAMRTLPISRRMICNAHRTLLSGLSKFRGGSKLPGEFKKHQNFIGGHSIESARFIPTPPALTEQAMAELETYINTENPMVPPVIDAALIHYQFETIHPFADGNGRVGRILVPICLMQRNVISAPLLYISPYIEAHKDSYIDLMYEVSRCGDWERWVSFFLDAIRESSNETIETITHLIDLKEDFRARARQAGRSADLQTITDSLFERPSISVPEAAAMCGVTYAAAARSVGKLVDAGILSEWSIEAIPKRFLAREVIRISAGHFRRPQLDTSIPT